MYRITVELDAPPDENHNVEQITVAVGQAFADIYNISVKSIYVERDHD